MKKIQHLAKRLNIQIDNVCQFLPQERVADFAKLSEVDLLDETLRAAASPAVLNGHDQLKALYSNMEIYRKDVSRDEGRVDKLSQSLRAMQQDVEKFRDRENAQKRIELLKAAVVASQYREAAAIATAARAQVRTAQANVRRLEEENEPTLQRVKDMEAYRDQIAAAVEYRKQVLRSSEAKGTSLLRAVTDAETEVTSCETQIELQRTKFTQKKKAVHELKTKITNLEAQRKSAPPDFDGAKWNKRIVSHWPPALCL
jgi:chromosome segregation ATPase